MLLKVISKMIFESKPYQIHDKTNNNHQILSY